jgi:ribosomal protein S27AE
LLLNVKVVKIKAMRIKAKCPVCSETVELTIHHLDRRQYCPKCGRMFKIPDADKLQKAIETAKQAGNSVIVDENGRIYG